MTDEIDACYYGLPRAQCHIGCGRWCRPARRSRGAHESLLDRATRIAHPACGTPECCQTCTTTTKEPSA